MLKCKRNYYIIFFSMICMFFIAGSSSAVLMGVYTDRLDFQMGSSTVFIEGTNGGDNELATVPFIITFHEDFVPEGKISKLNVVYTYDPTYLTFVSASPSEAWGTLVEGSEYFGGDPEQDGTINFTIFPDYETSYADVISGAMTVAYFEFTAKCQAQENDNPLEFIESAIGYVDVELTAGGRNTYTPTIDNCTNGSVLTEFYWVKTRVSSQNFEGALGTEITVPVSFRSNCLIDGLTFQMEYETDKLAFIGVEDYSTSFPGGFTGSAPAAGDFPIYISLETGPTVDGDFRAEFNNIFDLRFLVINEWDGDDAVVKWSSKYIDFDREFRIGNGTESYCAEVTNSLPDGDGSIWFLAGYQSIDAYTAGLESRLLKDDYRIWDVDGTSQDVNFAVKLCNNFETGTYVPGYDGAITAIVDPPDILSFNHGVLEQLPDNSVFFDYAYNSASDDTLAFYQNYQPFGYTNVLDMSACGPEGGVDVLNLSFELDDDVVTEFMGDDLFLEFTPSVSTFSGETRIEASQSNRELNFDNSLNTTAIPFKVATGEFSCDLETSSSFSVNQQYYIRNSFNLASFKVTVAVTSGLHYIQTVTPAEGVSYIIAPNYRSVIFMSNGDWVSPDENGERFQFAEIHFNNFVPELAASLGPGTGCYWIYSNSTIAFQNAFMSDFLNDNPLDPAGNLPYLFLAPNKIRKATYRCPEDPIALPRKDENAVIPKEFMLHQNYPNPFNPDTKIAFDLPEVSYVRIEIFNILGQHITTLVNESKPAGSYEINWDATDDNRQKVSSGIYLYLMQAGDYSRSAKMTLMK